jgi:HEAT repeat protein
VVRAAAAATLGKLGDRRAVEALIEATRDPMAEASEEAVKALGLLGDPRALPTLQAVMRNADGFFLENVRKSAEEASRRISARTV